MAAHLLALPQHSPSTLHFCPPPSAAPHRLARKKVSHSFGVTLCRGILCNWLVCLAVWQVRRGGGGRPAGGSGRRRAAAAAVHQLPGLLRLPLRAAACTAPPIHHFHHHPRRATWRAARHRVPRPDCPTSRLKHTPTFPLHPVHHPPTGQHGARPDRQVCRHLPAQLRLRVHVRGGGRRWRAAGGGRQRPALLQLAAPGRLGGVCGGAGGGAEARRWRLCRRWAACGALAQVQPAPAPRPRPTHPPQGL